jgi:hypothetical protein
MMRIIASSLAVAFGAVVVAGCATPGTSVKIETREQTSAVSQADAARCAESASVQAAAVQAVRDREYAACLLAAGYRINMPFRAGVEHTRVSIGSPTRRSAETTSADLAACETRVSAGRPGPGDVVAGQSGVMRQGDPLQVRPHSGQSAELTKELVSCLRERGYEAK